MNKTEAKLTTKLMKVLKSMEMFNHTFVAEVKVARNGKFYLKSGSFPKQRVNLRIAKHNGTIYKHPDSGFDGTPWDISRWYKVPAYLIVFFDKEFFVIDIDKIKADTVYLDRESANKISLINIIL